MWKCSSYNLMLLNLSSLGDALLFIWAGAAGEGTGGALAPSSGNPEKETNGRIWVLVTLGPRPTSSKPCSPALVRVGNKALPPR